MLDGKKEPETIFDLVCDLVPERAFNNSHLEDQARGEKLPPRSEEGFSGISIRPEKADRTNLEGAPETEEKKAVKCESAVKSAVKFGEQELGPYKSLLIVPGSAQQLEVSSRPWDSDPAKLLDFADCLQIALLVRSACE